MNCHTIRLKMNSIHVIHQYALKPNSTIKTLPGQSTQAGESQV